MAVMGEASRETARPLRYESEATGAEMAVRIFAYVVLISVAILMFVPFAFSVATSLKSNQEILNLSFSNLFIPENPTLEAYRTVTNSDIRIWFQNSVFVAAIWVIARAVIDSMAGYAFARMAFPGRNLIFLMILSTLMVPGIITIIPKFIILKELNLIGGYGALTVPFLADAFGIFLMKQFFESIPIELEEAARVDGASRYRMFVQIILPNAAPALTALAIFSFQGSWNAFLEPLIYVSDPSRYTLPLGLAYFQKANYTDWSVVMAIATITTIPIAIFYIFFQRFFVEGVTSSGIKG